MLLSELTVHKYSIADSSGSVMSVAKAIFNLRQKLADRGECPVEDHGRRLRP